MMQKNLDQTETFERPLQNFKDIVNQAAVKVMKAVRWQEMQIWNSDCQYTKPVRATETETWCMVAKL